MHDAIDPATYQAVERLIHEHAWLIDHGQADRLPGLYTEDGRVLGIGTDKVGRQAITEWAGQRAALTDRCSRHVQSNVRLEAVSPDLIRGTVVLTLYRHDGAGRGAPVPLMVGEYAAIYQRCPDETWRFAERRFLVIFGD